jgi:hypothetical protein
MQVFYKIIAKILTHPDCPTVPHSGVQWDRHRGTMGQRSFNAFTKVTPRYKFGVNDLIKPISNCISTFICLCYSTQRIQQQNAFSGQ